MSDGRGHQNWAEETAVNFVGRGGSGNGGGVPLLSALAVRQLFLLHAAFDPAPESVSAASLAAASR